jgi:hypothetical protein
MASQTGLEAVDQLLKDAGAPSAEHIVGASEANDLRRELLEQLKTIAETAVPEADSGGGKVLVGDNVHIRVGGTVWPLLTCTVTFVLAPLDPSGLTYGIAGGALVNAFKELAKVSHKLDPTQRVICRAVIEVSREKKAKSKKAEASVDELGAVGGSLSALT